MAGGAALVVADAVMPETDGRELGRQLAIDWAAGREGH
jgi:hypothetical protein